MFKEASPQFNPHGGRHMGEVERARNPRPVHAHTQRIQALTVASEDQVPKQLRPDLVARVVEGSELLGAQRAALDDTASRQGVQERGLSR